MFFHRLDEDPFRYWYPSTTVPTPASLARLTTACAIATSCTPTPTDLNSRTSPFLTSATASLFAAHFPSDTDGASSSPSSTRSAGWMPAEMSSPASACRYESGQEEPRCKERRGRTYGRASSVVHNDSTRARDERRVDLVPAMVWCKQAHICVSLNGKAYIAGV